MTVSGRAVLPRRQGSAVRALVVAPYYYPKIGGAENYARQLGIALNRAESCEIIIATSDHTGRPDHVDLVDGMRIYRLAPWLKVSNTPVNLLWPLKLRRIIRKERPDVILAHTPVPYMADAAALAAGKTPIILFYHAATLLKVDAPLFNLFARVYRLCESLTLRRATRIAAVSDYVKAQLSPRLQNKTVVVPNAVWSKEVVSRRQPAEYPHFVFVGSLERTHAWKGLDLIIRAVAHYEGNALGSAQLTIVGDGNYRQHYEQLTRDLGLSDAIHFTGALSGSVKDKEIAQATALICYPTSANDAFPTVILEAWALGVPVIAANIGPLPTLINDGTDGYLALPHDAAALATAMRQIAEMAPTQRSRIAEAAAERVLRYHTWEDQAALVAKLMRTLS